MPVIGHNDRPTELMAYQYDLRSGSQDVHCVCQPTREGYDTATADLLIHMSRALRISQVNKVAILEIQV